MRHRGMPDINISALGRMIKNTLPCQNPSGSRSSLSPTPRNKTNVLVQQNGMKLEGALKPHASNFKLFSNNVHTSGAGRGVQEQVSRKGAMCFPAVFLSDPRRSHGAIRTCQHVSRRKRSKWSKSTWEIRGCPLSERGKGVGSPNWPRRRGCFLIG